VLLYKKDGCNNRSAACTQGVKKQSTGATTVAPCGAANVSYSGSILQHQQAQSYTALLCKK